MSDYAECSDCGRADCGLYSDGRWTQRCPLCYRAMYGRYPAYLFRYGLRPGVAHQHGQTIPGGYEVKVVLDFGARMSRVFHAVADSSSTALELGREWSRRPRPTAL